MTIILPIPDPRLSPNGSHRHWSAKSKVKKKARELAKLTVWSALQLSEAPTFTRYRLRFYHSVARRRDDDNAAASCKSYRDGIAEALGVDDSTLRMAEAPILAIDKENPRLEITLLP